MLNSSVFDLFFYDSSAFFLTLYSNLRALTPLFGNGAEVHGIGKISGVLTKIGKLDIVLMYDVYIARLIPIIKLSLVYYEKRERKKLVFLYSMK